MSGISLAARNGANEGNIQVKELLIYNTAHDADTRAQVIAYLETL